MRTSLILSIVLHLFVLAAALWNFTSSQPRDIGPQPVSVELVRPSDVTQVKAGKKKAPEQEAASASPQEKKAESTPAPKAPDPKPAEKQAEKQAVPPPPKAEPPKAAEPEPKPEPEKKVAAKPEPAPAPPPKHEEPPKPKPEKQAEAKPKPEPKPEAKPKPEVKPEPKPDAKPEAAHFRDRIADLLKHPAEEQKSQPAPPAQTKQQFDPDRIAALLNRDPKAGSPAAQEGPKEPWRKPSSLQDQAAGISQPAAPPRETLGAPSGQDARMSVGEIAAALSSQIGRCWNIPVGGLGAENIVVKIKIRLNKDGTLAGQPQILEGGSSPFYQAASDAAMRAVLQCQPYSLPPEKYEMWSDLPPLKFDPKKMYGG